MDTLFLVVGPMAAVLMAWTLASRHRDHRPTAALLSVLLATNVAQQALDRAVLAPLRATLGLHPWTGWAWTAALTSHAIALVWPAALVGTALVVFLRRKPWAAVAAWFVAVLAYAWLHPLASDGGQMRFHGIVEMLAVVAAATMGMVRHRRAGDSFGAAPYALMVIIATELLALPNAFQAEPLPNWPSPQTLYLIMFAALVAMQAYLVIAERLAAHERRLNALDKGNLRATVYAETAIRAAQRAEEKASEARDLADNIPAVGPVSVGPKSTPTPTS